MLNFEELNKKLQIFYDITDEVLKICTALRSTKFLELNAELKKYPLVLYYSEGTYFIHSDDSELFCFACDIDEYDTMQVMDNEGSYYMNDDIGYNLVSYKEYDIETDIFSLSTVLDIEVLNELYVVNAVRTRYKNVIIGISFTKNFLNALEKCNVRGS